MKQISKYIITVVFCLLFTPALKAQMPDFEVTIIQRVPTLPSYPAAYMDNPLQYFLCTITNNTGLPAEVYLTCGMYYNNARIVYSDNVPSAQPLILRPGLNVIDQATIEDHFGGRMRLDLDALERVLPDYMNLLDQIATVTRLPEGDYALEIQVHPWVDETTPTDAYEEGTMAEEFEIVYSATPPEIITPLSEHVNWGGSMRTDTRDRSRTQQKTTKREDDFSLLTSMGRSSGGGRNALSPQRKLTFRWTPVITSSATNPQFEYTLKIVAVLPMQNAQDAIDHNPVVVTTTTRNTYAIIDTLQDMKYQFESGMTYAMQIQAVFVRSVSSVGLGGMFEDIVISNDGKSQVVTFSWGKARYSIQSSEISAPLDTAIYETLYHDNIPQLSYATKRPQITSPADTVNPATFDMTNSLQWTPVSGPEILDVKYTPRIYKYLGENECTLCQDPITDQSQMTLGETYYFDLETEITYRYHYDTVHALVHYVNGIEADTEADTVFGTATGSIFRHVGKVFHYGNVAHAKEKRSKNKSDIETPGVGLRLIANFNKDSLCVHLNWYHNYKSKADKDSRDKKRGKGLYHAVVYRSIEGGPYVGIASLPADVETFTDYDVQLWQNVKYYVKLHISPKVISKPSNIIRTRLRP